MNDLDEVPWWVFQMPEAVCYAIGNTEDDARKAMARNKYKDAPVHEWPCIGSRFTSRQALVATLTKQRLNHPKDT